MKMKMLILNQSTTNQLRKHISAATLDKLKIVKTDYLKLFKFTIKISGTSILLFLIYRQIPYFNKYSIHNVDNKRNNRIIEHILPIDYRATPYLPSCLTQMIYNELKSKPEIYYKREYVKTHDDGIISFDWVEMDKRIEPVIQGEINESPDKLLVILHGLTGGSETSYIKEIIQEFKKDPGFKIVAINYRGISESPLLTPFIYHAGYTEDLHTAMKHLKTNYPNLRCYAIGTSMGANIFTKFISNHHEFDDYIKGFVSISNPFNCLEVEKRNRGGILDMFIIRRQIRYIEKHKEILKEKVGNFIYNALDMQELYKIKYYREFDQLVTLKFFDFESVDDYYVKSSSVYDLEHVNVPSIFFNAQDDKLSPVETIDIESTFKTNPKIMLVVTRWGGHVCWFTGIKPKRWFIDKCVKFVDALEMDSKEKKD